MTVLLFVVRSTEPRVPHLGRRKARGASVVILRAHWALLHDGVFAQSLLFDFDLVVSLVDLGRKEREVCAAVVASNGEHSVVDCVLLSLDLPFLLLKHVQHNFFITQLQILLVSIDEILVDVGILRYLAVEIA